MLPMLYNYDLPLLVTKLKIVDAEDAKPLVQMLVPSPILIKNNDELLPPIIATLGQPLINPVIIAAPPAVAPTLLLAAAATTPPPVLGEANTTNPTTTTTSSTTSTTTTTTTTNPPTVGAATTPTPANPMDMVTTTAPTTTTTSTTTPQPNDTLPVVLDIEEPNQMKPSQMNATDEAVELPPEPKPNPVEQAEADTVAKTEYETVEYIPNVVLVPTPVPASKSNLLDEDADSQSNSVHEEYPSVLLGDVEHAAQNLQIPEEPPEQ